MLGNAVFKWVALGLVIPVLFAVSLDISYQESSSSGVIVPAYVWHGETQWDDKLFSAENNHPRVTSVVIFNCGEPGGPCAFQQGIQDNINTAKSHGMKTIGYVATDYGNRSPATVQAEINLWETTYDGIEGIFFDEMAFTAGSETYYSDLTTFVKGKPTMDYTVGNPGTDTIPSYIPTVDHIVIHESCSMPTLQSLDGWHADYDKNKFSYEVHTQLNEPDWTFVSKTANHVVYMYITDDQFDVCPNFQSGDGNPWNSFPTWIETLYATLDVPSVGITVDSKDLAGNPISTSKRNVEMTANGVKVRNSTSPLFYNATNSTSYTITVSTEFDSFVFDHWEDSRTNPTRTVTPTMNKTYTAFYNDTSVPPPPASYVVDLLDVYQSSSTTLDSGTAVCLNVDLETASSCAGMLNAGSTYRFEVEVRNDGGTASPTTFEFRDVINANDVLGTIPVGNILNSGCSTNADWTESIVTDDARASSGTTCSIGAGGSAEFWMVITLDTDAANGTGTFFVSDGTVSDVSAATTFTVNLPQQVPLTVKSASLSGNEITGMWVELWQNNTQIETGFTPFSTTVQSGVEYQVVTASFEDRIFDHWDDSSTNPWRTFTITQGTAFTAFYDVSLSHKFVEITTDQTTTSTTYTNIPGAIISDADLEDGDDYLLVFSALVSHSDVNQAGSIRAFHGQNVQFVGSDLSFEPTWGDTISRYPYFWFTVWNTAAGESVYLKFKTEQGDIMRADQITMVAINLSEELTAGTDYHFAENTIQTSMTSSYAGDPTTASITFTPSGTDDWLVLATSQLLPGSVTVPFQTRIHASGGVTDTGLEWIQESEDANTDDMVQTLAKVYTPAATSTTFEVETQRGINGNGTKMYNSIFALNLNKLNRHAFQVTPQGIVIDAGNSFATATNVATAALDPERQGDVWTLAFDIFYPHNQNFVNQRMQIDNTDQPATQTTDSYGTPDSPWSANDRIGYFMQSIEDLTNATHTVDVDATTINTNLEVRDRLVMMLTMRLGFILDAVSPLQSYFVAQQLFENVGMLVQNVFMPVTLQQVDAQQTVPAPVCRNETCNLHQKIVMIFDSPLAESELQATLNNRVVPLIEELLNTRFQGKITDKSMNNEYKLFETKTGTYEFYPDFNVLGSSTNLTDAELLAELDSTTAEIQSILGNFTSALEASNAHYYIHKSTGTIDTRK